MEIINYMYLKVTYFKTEYILMPIAELAGINIKVFKF